MKHFINRKFEAEQIEKRIIQFNKQIMKKLEKEIKEDEYSLYNALSALSFYKKIENEFLEIRNNLDGIANVKFQQERNYANRCIIGIFKVLEIIDLSNQRFPVKKPQDNIEKWKIIFLSIGDFILKLDAQNGIDEESFISTFNSSRSQINIADWISDDFKQKSFKTLIKKDFEMLNKLFYFLKEYAKKNDWHLSLIIDAEGFLSMLKPLLIDMEIPEEYLEYIILNLDAETIETHRPGLSINNPITKPLVKKGGKIFFSMILIQFAREAYSQIFNTCSFPFGINVSEVERNSISEQYSSLYSKKMIEIIEDIATKSGYKIEKEIMSKTWNKIDNKDLGDIDALMVNSDHKVVLINEIKYKKKHFYNMSSKFKVEKKWIKRQDERSPALKDYCKREFPKYDCYVNIITIDPINYDARLHYFNNVTLNVLGYLLIELKEGRETILKKI